ncbi:S8 family serine peptidase [Streptomyces longwoodensis]
MSQIKADQAWAVNPGSPSVKVGILDTGVDDRHQDLAPNFDAADSVSCAYGKPDTRAGAWRDVDTHGTHVAGTVAAAKNGKGVVGVAPGVKIAAVRVAEPGNSFFFAENTICGFVWAGDHGFKVTNNSYYTDPWQFNCPDNIDQAAIIEGVKRAQEYAESKGSLQIAAAGNENYDLAHKTTDSASPNDSTPVTRTITNACLDIPTELPGVVTVSANGTGVTKASFSNYGQGVIDVAAPGSNVYSTVPGGGYGSKSGTSMATRTWSAWQHSSPAPSRASLRRRSAPGWPPRPTTSPAPRTTAARALRRTTRSSAKDRSTPSRPSGPPRRPARTSRTSRTSPLTTAPPWRARSLSPA